MKLPVLLYFFIASTLCYAGTGNTKDTDLAYLLFLIGIGIILLIWNSIDYISRNRKTIKRLTISFIERVRIWIIKMIFNYSNYQL